MKGRRKIERPKWFWTIRFQAEASFLLEKRPKQNANRFLNAVSPFVMDHEPSGRLAGEVRNSASEENSR